LGRDKTPPPSSPLRFLLLGQHLALQTLMINPNANHVPGAGGKGAATPVSASHLAPARASERVRETTPGPTTLCSPELSPLQETSVYTTLERSAADRASQKRGLCCVCACLRTQTPPLPQLALALLHVCPD